MRLSSTRLVVWLSFLPFLVPATAPVTSVPEAAAVSSAMATEAASGNDYLAEIEAWHAQRIENLASETGWLTLVGLHPLRLGISTVGSGEDMDVRLIEKAPPFVGTLTVDSLGIVLDVAPEVAVRLAGNEDAGPVSTLSLATDVGSEPTRLELGSLLFYVIQRDSALFLRVKDRESELRKHFPGIERFPVDRSWRVNARLEAADTLGTVAVPNVLGQISESPSPGTLVFELAGHVCRLVPIGEPGYPLFIVFGDKTNGDSTYGGGRFLSTPPPDSTGAVVLDFNKATNPPCAFTPYATCPLPPAGNVLPIAVEAGEKASGTEH
jgi:uncharacterized protein (DUF1684 family)